MAFDLGAVIARIKFDTSDVKRGVGEAQNGIGRLSTFMAGGVAASKAFAVGLAAVGAGVAVIGGFAIKSAGDLQQTHAGFTTMLGDGKKAGALMQELNRFAAETPFEFPELADAGKKLLAFGFSSQQVVPTLKRLGDIASGLGIPLGELSELYGKARVQGRLYMEDVNQLTGRGIPVIQEFAKQFGVSEGKVRDLVEKGKIGFPELEKAMNSMTNTGGLFAGGMAKQAQTFNGMVSTVKDNIGAFMRSIVGMSNDGTIREGSIFALVQKGAAGLIEFLNANGPAMLAHVEKFMKFITDNGPIVVGVLLGALAPAFWSLVTTVVSGATAMIISLAPFIAIGALLGAAFMALKSQGIDPFKLAIDAVRFAIDWLKQGFVLLQPIVDIVKAAWQQMLPNITALGNTITTLLWPALKNLWNMLMQVWNIIQPTLIPTLQVLGAILGGLIFAAVWLVINAIRVIVVVISTVITAITALGAVFAASFAGMRAVGIAVWATIKEIIASSIAAARAVIQALTGFVSSVFNTIKNIVSSIMRGDFTGAFRTAVDGAKGYIDKIVGFVRNMVSGALDAVSRVKDGIVSPFRAAVDQIKGIMNSAKSALSNLNPFQRHSPSIVDWVKRGTRVIANEYDRLNRSIASGAINARVETIGTTSTLANVAENVTKPTAGRGGGGNTYVLQLDGVLADSPEAKRRLGLDIIQVINDGRRAAGEQTI